MARCAACRRRSRAILSSSAGGHQDMFVPNNNVVEMLDASGQLVPGIGNSPDLTSPGPAIPASDTGSNGTSGQPVTVPARVRRHRLARHHPGRELHHGRRINYQPGTLIVGINLGNLNQNMAYLTRLDISVSVLILIVLAMIGFAVVRTNLRPLVEIEETAGEIAAGHLNRRVPERDPRTEIGRLGRSLNIMLSQIEAAFHAREESEAAAHQSEERMRRFIADASHELRTPLTAIRGFAEYYRQRGGLVRRWDRDHAADTGAGRAGAGARGRAHARRPGPDHAAGGEGSGPDGAARRGPAAAGPARPAAAAGPAAGRPARAGRRRGARRAAAGAGPGHRPVGTARGRVPGRRRRAAAAAGDREPDEQRAHAHPGRDPDRGIASVPGLSIPRRAITPRPRSST